MKKFLAVGILLLTGCVTTPITAPVVMTDQHIASVSDAALCSLSKTNPDPRIDAEMQSRNVDCDPSALRCGAKGIKSGTKKFSKCKENQQAQQIAETGNKQYAATAIKQESSCGFMQEFFGGRDCRKEDIQRSMNACKSQKKWVDKMQCKQGVPISDPLDAEINAYISVLIEQVKTHQLTEAQAEYAFQRKVSEVTQRIDQANAEQKRLNLIERQQDALAHQQRMERMSETTRQNNDLMMEALKNNRQNTSIPTPAPMPIPTLKNPERTECRPDGYGGVTCTTYR